MLKSAILALSLTASSLAISAPAVAQTNAAKPITAPVDPVRLKLAEQTVAKLIPPGTYQKIMKDMMDTMAGGLVDQMMGMDASVIADMAGADGGGTEAGAAKGKTMADIAAEKDPNFKERMDITMKVMFSEMGNLMSEMEPVVRTAMSSIYARKYSAKELGDMNAFFSTPSGASFAGNFMASFTDKEMIDASFGMMPKMMEAMPAIMKKVEAATAHLPPLAGAPAEGNFDDNISFAYLDGAPECAKDDDLADCSAEDAATAATVKTAAVAQMGAAAAADAAADSTSAETGDEPWYAEENWQPANQKKFAKVSKTYEAASEKSSVAYAAFEEAQMNAIDEARQRYLAEGWKPATADAPIAAEDIDADAVPPPALPK